ncbi:UNVERIFIED_CONTAM: hypothetical protein PYX00_009899 [Menopon gallinae]|uniref:RING-type domain-containing protein n=1 Tax=Menopon gallinae TaxID=328185 RepID=A0AAW2HD46_9NEOP
MSLANIFSLSTSSEPEMDGEDFSASKLLSKSDLPIPERKRKIFSPTEGRESVLNGLENVRTPARDKENCVAFGRKSIAVRASKTRKTRSLKTLQNQGQSQSLSHNRRSLKPEKVKRKSRLSFDVYVEDRGEDGQSEVRESESPLLQNSISAESESALDEKNSISPNGGVGWPGQASPRKEIDRVIEETASEIVADLSAVFPGVDAEFIKAECECLKGPLKKITESIVTYLENNKAASECYKAHVQRENLEQRFTRNFSPEEFLKIIPDPWKYFEGTERKDYYPQHSIYYLMMKFRKYYKETIEDSLELNNRRLYLAYKHLMKKNRGVKEMATSRSWSGCQAKKPADVNLQFLLEVAFIENEETLKNHVKSQTVPAKQKAKEVADKHLLVSCMKESCSFSSVKDDFVECAAGHTFCRNCVTESVLTGIEKEECCINCLTTCTETFSMNAIEFLLSPKQFSKMVELYELHKETELKDLARCPFCWFVRILPENVRIISCLNLDCLKETCRDCKGINHLPLRCD